MKKSHILFKTPQCEIEFRDLCMKQYLHINGLLGFIESEFNTSMHNHPELRHRILDISNFIKRMPDFVSEVITHEVQKKMDTR